MGFMDSYKHLEKLCGDMMGDDRRLSAYIDEMAGKPYGSRYVVGWESDLRKLKHYRWVRNQIVHEPDYSEDDLCGPEDVEWLEDFYDRIMDQTDPLTLYRKATQPKNVPRETAPMEYPVPPQSVLVQPKWRKKPAGCAIYLLGMVGALLLLLI